MNPRSLVCAAIAALLLFSVPALSAPKPIPPGLARAGKFQVIKRYVDGPWLVPTLHAIRSSDDWDRQMGTWLLEQKVVGREAAPNINWNHQAVVVLSLGSQMGECGVDVKHCTVQALTTLFDLHFVTPTQWDPNGSVQHPAVLIAIDRSDLKNLEIRFDSVIDGLPSGQNRRATGIGLTSGATPAPSSESVGATFDATTTWGRLKDVYRR